jgi:uncharacterized membrane protein YbhN (UPF0104 family)
MPDRSGLASAGIGAGRSDSSADGRIEGTGAPAWRRLAPWVFGLLSLSILVAVVAHLGEIERFVELARGARPHWLLLAGLVQVATYACAAGVWHRALRRAGHPKSLASLVPLGVAKLFTDQAVPTGGISGTVLVVRGLGRRQVPAETAMAALLIGLVSFYTAYLSAALISLSILWLHHRASPVLLAITALFSAAAVGVPAAVLWLRRLATRAVPAWLARLPGIGALLDAAAQAPTDLLRDPRLLGETVALQLAVFVLDALTLWLAFRAIGEAIDFWVVFVSFITASIAATIGPIPLGLGTFEAGSVAMLGLLGVPLESALTATLLLRGLTFWLPMLPGLWLARREIGPG